MKMESRVNDPSKVVTTAWSVAFRRSLTDIPYASDFYREFLSGLAENEKETEKEQKNFWAQPELVAQIEARHKIIDSLIARYGTDQILEIASGLSTRGITQSEKNRALKYVELDLPEMIAEKRKILDNLNSQSILQIPQNLKLIEGDALEFQTLLSALAGFDRKPITVINEGLLRYLNFKEKAQVAQNIRKLLEQFGGVWITPDITLQRVIRNEKISGYRNFNYSNNIFADEKEARQFFEKQGFEIESHSFLEVADQLSSPDKLQLPLDKVRAMLELPVVFVMRLRAQPTG